MKASSTTLAIVIPAYKKEFIADTLNSLASQTDKRFKLYIGNDAGDTSIDHLVDEYLDKLDIVYKRFDENLGKSSLVSAWHRCIEMTKDEPWIWVLPDDDFISEKCVEGLLEEVEKKNDQELIRFNSSLINEKGVILKTNPPFPEVEVAFVSFMEKIRYNRTSTLAEYVFKREAYKRTGGFPELPLAWGSDDAAWYLFGHKAGIKTIKQGAVFLRQSSLNISNDYSLFGAQKIEALLKLFITLNKESGFRDDIQQYKIEYNFEKETQFFLFNEMRQLNLSLSFNHILYFGNLASQIWSGGRLKNSYRFWLNNSRNKRHRLA